MSSKELAENDASTKCHDAISSLQGKHVDGAWCGLEDGAVSVDCKGKDGRAVPILGQECRKSENDTFSTAESLGELIEHKQNVRQIRRICILWTRIFER